MERLSRLTQLTPLVMSYESLSEPEKAGIAASLQNIIRDPLADLQLTEEETFELEPDKPNTQSDHPCGHINTPSTTDAPPRTVTRDDPAGSALVEVTSNPRSLATSAEPADPESSPTQTVTDQTEEPPAHDSSRVSSLLAILYSGFLASVRQMGVLLSPRTVLPRPEEQDDETKVTQELSQAQRRLVTEEECIWRRLSEATSEVGIEGDVSWLAREIEDKSAKILTSYERRNNPPTKEVYDQSRVILQAMGVPCINTKGGVEGEALAAAIVRDGFADYVASEDTVSFPPSLWHPRRLTDETGCTGLRCTSPSQCHQRRRTSHAH